MKLFKFAETEFINFDDTIRKYLVSMFHNSGLQYSKSQIYDIIFEGVKGVMQNAMFYIEDALTEQNVSTAYRKSSIYSLAKVSGYEPYYGSAATGTIKLMTSISNRVNAAAPKVYIKNGTTILNNVTGVSYLVYLPTDYYVVDMAKPLMTHELKIVQGVWSSATYAAKGSALESVHVTTNAQYDRDYVEVYVDGEKWTEAATLYDMSEDSHEYFITTGYDNTFDVIFGNGVYGKKLDEGQAVIVNYISHVGEKGNIYDNSSYSLNFYSECYDNNGGTVNANDYFTISISSQISGGSAADDIDTVRKMIGYNSRSLVIANADNFKLFLKRFSFIGQTNVWNEANSLNVVVSALSNYKSKLINKNDYFNLSDEDLKVTDEQKSMVVSTFNNSKKTFAGINLVFKDPIIRKFAIIAYLKVDNDYNKELAKDAVENSIADYFIGLDANVKFIPKSDIIKKVLDENDFIKSIDITFISQAAENAYADGYYYKYEQRYTNGFQQYIPVKYMYDGNSIGLDLYGNIQLESEMEIPFISGNFRYYTDKANGSTDFIDTEAFQFFFI